MGFFLRDAEKIICVLIFSAMTVLGFVNVAVRYLTDYSLAASEELLINGFLILTIFGAAIAARNGEHLAVTILYDIARPSIRRLILAVSALLSVFLLALSAWFAWQLVMDEMTSGLRSYGLQIPAWYYNAALPFGFALIIVRYVQHARETWRNLDAGETSHV